MAKITQKQLIEQIKTLKDIKPRKEWAVLFKTQLLSEEQVEVKIPAQKVGIFDALYSVFFQRKLAYAFAAVLILIVGVFGFSRYAMPGDLFFPVKNITEQSQAALAGQTQLKQEVAIFNSRINDLNKLAQTGKKSNMPSAINEVNAKASVLAANLKNNPVKDSNTIKDIANSLKTLADVPGADLTVNSNIEDLYQTVVQSQIADLQKTTLTDDQKKILTSAESLYSQGKYEQALEEILPINK